MYHSLFLLSTTHSTVLSQFEHPQEWFSVHKLTCTNYVRQRRSEGLASVINFAYKKYALWTLDSTCEQGSILTVHVSGALLLYTCVSGAQELLGVWNFQQLRYSTIQAHAYWHSEAALGHPPHECWWWWHGTHLACNLDSGAGGIEVHNNGIAEDMCVEGEAEDSLWVWSERTGSNSMPLHVPPVLPWEPVAEQTLGLC